MTLILAGDIGGTKTILRLVEAAEAGATFDTLCQANYPSQKFPDLVPIVQQFLDTARQQLGNQRSPQIGCFAIAGPVVNNTSKLTNLSWLLTTQRLEKELGMEKISLINDFAAVCYGILGLSSVDLYTLQAGIDQENAPIGVLGAGTGLGEGFLVPHNSNYEVFSSEGGHADFAPRSELEWQLLRYLQKKYNIERVSVERVVSGQGIVAIYQFLRDQQFAPEFPEVGEVIRKWEKEKTVDPAAVISQAALQKRDRLSEKTMQMFIEAYGAEAGNLALKLLPYGGLYIAGGIAAKNLPLMQDGRFISAFNEKGRVSPLLQQVPVHIVLNPQVGLLGSVLYALKS